MLSKEEFLKLKNLNFKNKLLFKDITFVVNKENTVHLLVAKEEAYNKLKEKEEELQQIVRQPVSVEIYRLEPTEEIEKEFKETWGEESYGIY